MNETTLTMAGHLVKGEGGWQDGDTLFMTVTAWRALAENVAESASKGTRVIVTGRLKQRSYGTGEGGRPMVYELYATDVGISLQRATARPVRAGVPGRRQQWRAGAGLH
jgi:single-strand DNA-binding protein